MTCSVASNSQFVQSYQYRCTVSHLQQLTVFCDFDGPIVDVSDRYYSTYKLGLAQTQAFYEAQGISLMLQPLSKEEFWQMKQERVSDITIAIRSGLQEEQIEYFLQHVRKIVNHPVLLKKDKMQPGVNWALRLLHSEGVRLVLVTLRCQNQVTRILSNYGLKRLFRGIYGTRDCHAAYQNNAELKTQLLKEAIAAHGQTSAYMVGDTEADILAAQALGIPAIALSCGIRSSLYLQQFQPLHLYTDLLSTAHNLLAIAKATH
ncbi:MAG: HAD family hydrolase [Moorea sp. SIO2B7]|nr:HAD family hydrolase [Moorena sp. SIO2B7]